MKTHRSDARRAPLHRAAASREDAPLQTVQATASDPQRSLREGIDDSPRVQAQRRAIQTVFGDTHQRRDTANTPRGDMPVQRIRVSIDGESIDTDHYSYATLFQQSIRSKMSEVHRQALKEELELRKHHGLMDPILAPVRRPDEKEAKRSRTLARNLEARALLRRMLDEGQRSGDTVLKNSCEYALSGAKKIYAVTVLEENYDVLSEGDRAADKRAIQVLEEYVLLYPKAESAQDPCDILSPANPGYQIDDYTVLADDPHIGVEASRRTKGWALGGAIAVVVHENEASARSYLYETLKHEVQHSVDGSEEETAGLGERSEHNLMALALARYKTEYRAFYAMDHARVRELREQGALDRMVAFDYGESKQVTELQNVLFGLAFRDMQDDFFMTKSEHRKRARKTGPHEPMLIFEDCIDEFVGRALLLDPLGEMINPFNSARIVRLYGALRGKSLIAIRQSLWQLEKQEAIFIRTNRAAKLKVEALLSSFPKGSQDLIRSWIPHAG